MPDFKMLSACCNVVAAGDPSILLQGNYSNQPKKTTTANAHAAPAARHRGKHWVAHSGYAHARRLRRIKLPQRSVIRPQAEPNNSTCGNSTRTRQGQPWSGSSRHTSCQCPPVAVKSQACLCCLPLCAFLSPAPPFQIQCHDTLDTKATSKCSQVHHPSQALHNDTNTHPTPPLLSAGTCA